MIIHDIDIGYNYIDDIKDGMRLFEVLPAEEHDCKAGDCLALHEKSENGRGYTGRTMLVRIDTVYKGINIQGQSAVIVQIFPCVLCGKKEVERRRGKGGAK